MAVAKKTVELFYDVVSPFTWIAFETLCRYRNKWDINLQFKPFFLGGVMQASGNKPPGLVPNKAAYMFRDIERLANHYQMPIKHPSNIVEVMFEKGTLTAQRMLTSTKLQQPNKVEDVSQALWMRVWSRNPAESIMGKGSLSAMRFLTAVNLRNPQFTEAVSRELWMRIWSRDQDITEADSLKEAGLSAGLSESQVKDILSALKSPEVKEALKNTTEEALEHGAFGSPTIVAHDAQNATHVVFGSDRMHILADILGEKYEGPLNEYKSKL